MYIPPLGCGQSRDVYLSVKLSLQEGSGFCEREPSLSLASESPGQIPPHTFSLARGKMVTGPQNRGSKLSSCERAVLGVASEDCSDLSPSFYHISVSLACDIFLMQ